jgi:hypothetical protein
MSRPRLRAILPLVLAAILPLVARTAVGSRRVLDMLIGEQLPRIC